MVKVTVKNMSTRGFNTVPLHSYFLYEYNGKQVGIKRTEDSYDCITNPVEGGRNLSRDLLVNVECIPLENIEILATKGN